MNALMVLVLSMGLGGCYEAVGGVGSVETAKEDSQVLELLAQVYEGDTAVAFIDSSSEVIQSFSASVPGVGSLKILIPPGSFSTSGDLLLAEGVSMAGDVGVVSASPAVYLSQGSLGIQGELRSPLRISLPLSVGLGLTSMTYGVLSNDGFVLRLIDDVVVEGGILSFSTMRLGSFQAVVATEALRQKFSGTGEVVAMSRAAPAKVVREEKRVAAEKKLEEIREKAMEEELASVAGQDSTWAGAAVGGSSAGGTTGGSVPAYVPPAAPTAVEVWEMAVGNAMAIIQEVRVNYFNFGTVIPATTVVTIKDRVVIYDEAIARIRSTLPPYDQGVLDSVLYAQGIGEASRAQWRIPVSP